MSQKKRKEKKRKEKKRKEKKRKEKERKNRNEKLHFQVHLNKDETKKSFFILIDTT